MKRQTNKETIKKNKIIEKTKINKTSAAQQKHTNNTTKATKQTQNEKTRKRNKQTNPKQNTE